MNKLILLLILIFTLLLGSCSSSPDIIGGQGEAAGSQELCEQSGGSWLKVDKASYPADASAGVFDTENHPDFNFLCDCGDKLWQGSSCQ